MSDLPTRKTLIERIIENDDELSWEMFHDLYKPYIFAIITNMGVSYHDAEELAQDVLIKAWKALPDFNYQPGKIKFRTWLCKIVKNLVFNYFRDHKLEHSRKSAKEISDFDIVSKPEIDDITEKEWRKFVVAKAWEIIKQQFEPHVLAIFTTLSEGEKTALVAQRFKVKETTVLSYKSRVRRALYREIAKIDYELNC